MCPQPELHLTFTVDKALRFLLPAPLRSKESFAHIIRRQASLKDVVESLGIPHTEIGALQVAGREVNFKHRVADADVIAVAAVTVPLKITVPTLLRPAPYPEIRFLVDANVGRLARLLRMAGFDTAYQHAWHDAELAKRAAEERRILLTRDRALLRYACIDYGRLVRAEDPREQLAEVIQLLGLHQRTRPFTRCMRCNGLLQTVSKQEVYAMLQPLTQRYYHDFKRCRDCGQIYWEGTHKKGLEEILSQALNCAAI